MASFPFVVSLDLPSGNNRIDFRHDGDIALSGHALTGKNFGFANQPAIATYDPDIIQSVAISIDLDRMSILLSLNSVVVYDGILSDSARWLASVRMTVQDITHTSMVGVDNIRIYAVPEPGVIAFAPLLAFVLRRALLAARKVPGGCCRRRG